MKFLFILFDNSKQSINGAEHGALYRHFRGIDYANDQISSQGAPPHEQVMFIRLKQEIYYRFAQLREFVESEQENSND